MAEYSGVVAPMPAAIMTETGNVPFNCIMAMNAQSPMAIIFVSAEQTVDGDVVEWQYDRELMLLSLIHI